MQEKTIKIHAPLFTALEESLHAIFEQGVYADKEVARALKANRNWGSRDRSFFAETVYDIVRWKRKYAFQLEQSAIQDPKNNVQALIGISLLNRNYAIQNPERTRLTSADIDLLKKQLLMPIAQPAIATSYPVELYNYCEQALGNTWHAIAEQLNTQAKVYLRVNTLKSTKKKISEILEKENIAFRDDCQTVFSPYLLEDSLEIITKNKLKNSTHYTNGYFEFQDIGSQLISVFALQNIPDFSNFTLLDMCAGAGGKTLHLSTLMKNKGKIIATDFNEKRLVQLQKRIQHAGCKNVEITDFSALQNMTNRFDFILIDAPCSGLGTLKRSPDIKWKLSIRDIENYCNIQQKLLHDASTLLNKNGTMLYATCSILPQENENQIQRFLENKTAFKLAAEIKTNPAHYPSDGFYMAKLQIKK
ncbi:MAG TPA: RsmB/NOP family class I SAM-dependent RNA methyltransferase [Chitinophagales bacterium]|nr:RsmB/NOP family class I SAM-dependent RNA methyltransferase [Chitinophagales bacterium]